MEASKLVLHFEGTIQMFIEIPDVGCEETWETALPVIFILSCYMDG